MKLYRNLPYKFKILNNKIYFNLILKIVVLLEEVNALKK